MRYVALSNARSRLTDLVDSAERTVITKNGAPAAILLNVDDYRALQTTANLAKDPQHLLRVLEGHEAVQRGDHGDFVEFSEGMSLQGLVDEVEEEDREGEEVTARVLG